MENKKFNLIKELIEEGYELNDEQLKEIVDGELKDDITIDDIAETYNLDNINDIENIEFKSKK